MKLIFKILSLLFCLQSFAQTENNQEKIKNHIETYFKEDREIIHVQFNKNDYVTNEDIGFKGYIWNKNTSKPSINTVNVQLIIYNEQQEVVQKQLLYATNGTFSGGVHLSEKLKSGKYFFHFFTNWMNNFKEDDSFRQTIEIFNKKDSYDIQTTEPIFKTATITLHPEGGSIIEGITNAVGITVKDCNQKGIEIKEGVLLDSKSNEIVAFKTNKMGYGVLYFIPNSNETYSVKIVSDKLSITKLLPKTKETGIIVTYNNNLPNDKLIIVVKTNKKGIELNQNKKFTLLIQQDAKLAQQEFVFPNKDTEKIFFFDKKTLDEGVYSIRLLDENLNEVTERLLYISAPQPVVATLEVRSIANDSIALSLKTNGNQAHLSLSVLPKKTTGITQKRTILGTFYLNAYLQNPELNNYSYYDLENKDRKQDIELLMLNQDRSKYSWENIKSNPPKINAFFDKGVTISGTINKELDPKSKYKISLVSLKNNVMDETIVDSKNNFKFENFFARDSTLFILQLKNQKNTSISTKIYVRVLPNQNMFPLPMQFEKTICPPLEKNPATALTFAAEPSEKGMVNLKGVTVISKAKEVLKHEQDMSAAASGYKITDQFGTVLDFLNRNGFRTGMDPETNDVYIKSNRGGFMGDSSNSPAVYIDNNLVFDLNFLINTYLIDVDEIYIDQSGASDITAGANGTIKIFLKDPQKNRVFNIKYATFIVKNGFAQDFIYKNASFTNSIEQSYFGTLNWSPTLTTKDNPTIDLKFPIENQKEINVVLEGFTEDGKLISIMKTIPVNTP